MDSLSLFGIDITKVLSSSATFMVLYKFWYGATWTDSLYTALQFGVITSLVTMSYSYIEGYVPDVFKTILSTLGEDFVSVIGFVLLFAGWNSYKAGFWVATASELFILALLSISSLLLGDVVHSVLFNLRLDSSALSSSVNRDKIVEQQKASMGPVDLNNQMILSGDIPNPVGFP